MAPARRRSLFRQLYLILLASLMLVALLGAGLWHVLGQHAMGGRIRVHVLGILLTVAAVVGVAAYPVMSRMTRRLEALRLGGEAWGAGDLARRAAVEGSDEIAAVAASFNVAADRVERLLAAHKTLLAHASHELRSPLARLAMAAEMLSTAPAGDLAPSFAADIAELDSLVGEILLASRLDSGADADDEEAVDCLALVAEEAARAGVHVRPVEPTSTPFEVDGSPRLLRRLVRNLIDNALRHGAPPVEIALARRIEHGEETIAIAVVDHGRGPPAALRERVFEPFFRPDGWSEEAGSWGLGLALVRQIARRHGGDARCEADPAGLTCFVVVLPTRRPSRV